MRVNVGNQPIGFHWRNPRKRAISPLIALLILSFIWNPMLSRNDDSGLTANVEPDRRCNFGQTRKKNSSKFFVTSCAAIDDTGIFVRDTIIIILNIFRASNDSSRVEIARITNRLHTFIRFRSRNICADGANAKRSNQIPQWKMIFIAILRKHSSRLEFFPWLKRNQFARWIFFAFDLRSLLPAAFVNYASDFVNQKKRDELFIVAAHTTLNSRCFRANRFLQFTIVEKSVVQHYNILLLYYYFRF